MKVHLTFDIEVWCNSWENLDARFPAAYERYVYGDSREHGYAMPQTLRIMQSHGLRGVFFVEPLFSARFGAQHLAELVGPIRAAAQDVQMHLHPEWVDEIRPPLIANASVKRQHLNAYTLEEQTALISWGKRALESCGATPIDSFRAGSFGANQDTFRALSRCGIRCDSSLNVMADISGPDVAARATCGSVIQVEGLSSFPVTVFRDGLGRLRPAQVGACSFEELRAALEAAYAQGRKHFVVVSHNFEMLKPGSSRVDRIVAQRFRKLCRYLDTHRDRFQVASFEHAGETAAEPRLSVGRWPTGKRLVEQALRRVI